MSHEYSPESNGPLSGFERGLAGLRPAALCIDRDRLMFLAGQASGAAVHRPASSLISQAWLWPASSAVLAATSLALAIVLFHGSNPQPSTAVAQIPSRAMTMQPEPTAPLASGQPSALHSTPVLTSTTTPTVQVANANNYVRTREIALRMGVDALGTPVIGQGYSVPAAYGELLRGVNNSPSGRSSPPTIDLSM